MIDRDFTRAIKYGFVWEKIPKAEYEAIYKARKAEYDAKMKEYNKQLFDYQMNRATWMASYGNDRLFHFYYAHPIKPYGYFPGKIRKVPFHGDYDRFFKENYKEHSDYFDSMSRDGKMSETGRSTGFKNAAKRDRRNSDKKNIQKIMLDIDAADDMVWQDNKNGKARIWDYW